MKVTIIGLNKVIGSKEEYEGIDYDLITIKEIHKRNGNVVTDIRIKRGKRDIVVSSGCYQEITIQEEETGRYIFRYNR